MVLEVSLHGIPNPKLKKILKRAAQETFQSIPLARRKRLLKRALHPELSISVISSAKMKRLNFKFRKKNRPTDVLSFSRVEKPPAIGRSAGRSADLGEVLIAWQVAKRQAKEYEIPLNAEMVRLTIHGVLHIFGYDHERSQSQEKIMFALQNKILKRLTA